MTSTTDSHHHITPLWVYLAVGGALLVLTGITVAVALVDFNALLGIPYVNLIIAMVIATIKATLVALFFMHLIYDNKLNSLVFLGALAALAVFILLTMVDTLRRSDLYEFEAGNINPAKIYDSNGKPKMAPPDHGGGEH